MAGCVSPIGKNQVLKTPIIEINHHTGLTKVFLITGTIIHIEFITKDSSMYEFKTSSLAFKNFIFTKKKKNLNLYFEFTQISTVMSSEFICVH